MAGFTDIRFLRFDDVPRRDAFSSLMSDGLSLPYFDGRVSQRGRD